MYDLPPLRPAAEAVWRALARALRRAGVPDVPDRLTWDAPPVLWSDPALLFSQACGYPLLHGFAGRLRPVATPCYRAEGCAGPLYRSAVVVHGRSLYRSFAECRGRVCAVNGWDSHSGWQALAALAAPLADDGGFFRAARLTGSHVASATAVAGGTADLAAIDAVCWALMSRHRPDLTAGLRVLCWTDPAPGLPFVTRSDADDRMVARLRDGVAAMLADPGVAAARDALLLVGAETLEVDDYALIRQFAARASVLGHPVANAA